MHLDSAPSQHVAVVDRENTTILWLSSHARETLQRYFGTVSTPSSALPDALRRWLTGQRAALVPCEAVFAPPLPFVMHRPGGQLHVCLAHLCPGTAVLLLEEQRTAASARLAEESTALTPREAEILDWVAEGKRNSEIGLILGVSERTVEKHLEHIFEKLGVETRTAAIREALERRKAQPA